MRLLFSGNRREERGEEGRGKLGRSGLGIKLVGWDLNLNGMGCRLRRKGFGLKWAGIKGVGLERENWASE